MLLFAVRHIQSLITSHFKVAALSIRLLADKLDVSAPDPGCSLLCHLLSKMKNEDLYPVEIAPTSFVFLQHSY